MDKTNNKTNDTGSCLSLKYVCPASTLFWSTLSFKRSFRKAFRSGLLLAQRQNLPRFTTFFSQSNASTFRVFRFVFELLHPRAAACVFYGFSHQEDEACALKYLDVSGSEYITDGIFKVIRKKSVLPPRPLDSQFAVGIGCESLGLPQNVFTAQKIIPHCFQAATPNPH